MNRHVKKSIKVRKRWVINPKTKIKESDKAYYRPREKRKVIANAKDKT